MQLMKKHRSVRVAKGRGKRSLPRPKPKASSLATFLEVLQASGRYTFRRTEALKALGISPVALKHALWRQAKAGRVAAPRRGFYVIVPPEYRAAGSPPADWFIDDLMTTHLGRPYYAGLLTAAALHGAAHQAPQEFQVVTDRPLPMIEMGRLRIRFVKKAHLKVTPTVRVNPQTGQM